MTIKINMNLDFGWTTTPTIRSMISIPTNIFDIPNTFPIAKKGLLNYLAINITNNPTFSINKSVQTCIPIIKHKC